MVFFVDYRFILNDFLHLVNAFFNVSVQICNLDIVSNGFVGLIFIREEIVIWARKKSGVPVIRIRSVAEAEEFLKKYHTFVTGLFKKFEVCGFELFQELSRNSISLR